jgi:hypothetical protein
MTTPSQRKRKAWKQLSDDERAAIIHIACRRLDGTYLKKAVAELLIDLEAAAVTYRTKKVEGHQLALDVVCDFLTAVALDKPRLVRMLDDLIYDLEPRAKNAMRLDTAMDMAMRLAAVELLHQGGMPVKAALYDVSVAAKISVDQLENERKQLKRGNAALRWYYDVLVRGSSQPGDNVEKSAEALLFMIERGIRPRIRLTADR